MSDGEERDARRRRSEGGGIGRWLTLGGWLLAAVLGGYLLFGRLGTGDGDRATGLVSERILLIGAFWLPLVALVCASLLGILWTMRVYARREKSSLLWTRNAFVFGLVSALLLVIAAQDPRNFKREWLAAWCALLSAAQVSFFAYAALREVRRTSGSRSRSSEINDGEGG